MDPRRIQILMAFTILFIGTFYIIDDVMNIIGLDVNTVSGIYKIISVIILVLSVTTFIVLIRDARKKI